MYVFLDRAMLDTLGYRDAALRRALQCCLVRVRRDRYTFTRRCEEEAHASLQRYAADEGLTLAADQPGLLGDIERLRRGVAAIRGRQPVGSVLSHTAAALVHQLPLVTVREMAVELIVPGRSRRRNGLRVRDRRLPAGHVEENGGYRVTTPARTVADIARDHGLELAVPMLDHLLAREEDAEGGAASAMRRAVEAAASVYATPAARGSAAKVLAQADERRESPAESLCAVRFFQHALTGFEPQAEIRGGDGDLVARVDFLHRDARLIVEVDGLSKYTADGNDRDVSFRAEREREYALRNLGYMVVRLTWKDLFRAVPFERIRDALVQRERLAERDGLVTR
jgi:very-short-patch-repair endonuclease